VAGYLEEGGEERELVDGAGHGRGQRPAGRRRGERRRGDEDDGAAVTHVARTLEVFPSFVP